MQQPQAGGQHGREVDAKRSAACGTAAGLGVSRIRRGASGTPPRRTTRHGWRCRRPAPGMVACRDSGLGMATTGKHQQPKLPQQQGQQHPVDEVQDQVGFKEGPRVGGPVACIKQKAQQRQRAASGIGAARCDVAPERGPVIHRAGGTQGGQVGVVIKKKAA